MGLSILLHYTNLGIPYFKIPTNSTLLDT